MAKLIPMEEAAQMLGVTVEELTDMRSRSEIFGYRDGSSWKFKEQEVQRVAAQRAAAAASNSAASDSDDLMVSPIDDDLDRLVDVNDLDAAAGFRPGVEADDELALVEAADTDDSAQGKPSTIVGADDDLALEKDLQLDPDDSDVLDLSDEGTQSRRPTPGAKGPSPQLEEEEDEELQLESDELRLAADDDFELSTMETITAGSDEDADFQLSEAELDLDIGSEVDLAKDGARARTIPADDGISLEGSPTELASDEDEFTLSDDVMVGGSDSVQLKADNDFLLTPIDQDSAIDESDSGSQVIELDEEFETSGEPLITEADEEVEGIEPTAVPLRTTLEPATEYSIWNVLGLALIVFLFLPTGLMMIDLMRNMWSWGGTNVLSSSLMDTILSMFGV